MINENSIHAVDSSIFSKSFRAPLYGSYCFSEITPSCIQILKGSPEQVTIPQDCFKEDLSSVKHIVLLLADAFGWNFYEKYRSDYEIFSTFEEQGVVSKFTSQYPSTTANHITSICSGLTPNQNKVFDWSHFEPRLGKIVWPLPYSLYRGEFGSLAEQEKPESLFPCESAYKEVKADGVEIHSYLRSKLAAGPYHKYILRDFDLHHFDGIDDALNQVVNNLKACQEKGARSLHYFHYVPIDTALHNFGPFSPEVEQEIDIYFNAIQENFFEVNDIYSEDTLCLLFADHGQASIFPKTTTYLNLEYPEIVDMIQTDAEGKPVLPVGSCRNFCLHLKDGVNKSELKSTLNSVLDGKAEAFLTDELIEAGLFGPAPHPNYFLERISELVVFPYNNEAIWWGKPSNEGFLGRHGGLTAQEIDIPFFSLRI